MCSLPDISPLLAYKIVSYSMLVKKKIDSLYEKPQQNGMKCYSVSLCHIAGKVFDETCSFDMVIVLNFNSTVLGRDHQTT